MNLKKIKAAVKLLVINISIIYALLLIINLIIIEDDLTEDHIIVNIKRYGKNKKYSGFIDDENLERIDGEVDRVFKVTTGELGDIKLEKAFNITQGISTQKERIICILAYLQFNGEFSLENCGRTQERI